MPDAAPGSASPEPAATAPAPASGGARQVGDRMRWVWLIYLVFFLMGPILYGSARHVGYAAAGVGVFLALYAWAGRIEGWRLLAPIAGMVALGLGFVAFNPGASVFFVYAAAECAHLGSRRRAWTGVGLLMALVVAVAASVQGSPFFLVPAAAIVAVVGASTIHHVEMAHAQRALRRSREEVERVARIAERERIARDLHDLLGHTLSVVVLKSELAARLAARDPARAALEIREVETVARQALAEVRAAVTAYRAETLAGELDNARRALAAAGVTLEVELEPVRLPPLHEGVLALALREAITNVIRHAGATRCRVALGADGNDAVRMAIEDDGRGATASPSPSGSPSDSGSGLRGMRERVAGLGGRVETQAARLAAPDSGATPGPRAGTRLEVRLPLPHPAVSPG